jgi:hypothetical protein
MIARASTSDVRNRVRAARRGGSRRRHPSRSTRRTPRLAILVQGGAVQGVYADRCGPLTVYLLDYDDLVGDEALAGQVVATRELPEIGVEAGLARAVAEYRAVAARRARRQRTAEVAP